MYRMFVLNIAIFKIILLLSMYFDLISQFCIYSIVPFFKHISFFINYEIK